MQRLNDFLATLPRCPHGCHILYPTPTFNHTQPIDEQVDAIINRYREEAPRMLEHHLAAEHPNKAELTSDSQGADRLRFYAAIGFPVQNTDGTVTLSVEQLQFAAHLADENSDASELTRADAISLADELGSQLYQAEDRLAFIREQADAATGPIDPAELVRWTNRAYCMRVDPADGPSAESVVRMLRDSRVSVLQAAFRELGWRIDFQLAEEKP
jgi:hypothetical protein